MTSLDEQMKRFHELVEEMLVFVAPLVPFQSNPIDIDAEELLEQLCRLWETELQKKMLAILEFLTSFQNEQPAARVDALPIPALISGRAVDEVQVDSTFDSSEESTSANSTDTTRVLPRRVARKRTLPRLLTTNRR